MKIVYKMVVKYPRDQHKEYQYLFDDYETIEEGLEKHFEKDNKALGIKIEALALCDRCKEYKLASVSELMRKYGQITVLCEDCFDTFKINIERYSKENNERDIKTRNSKTKKRNGE